MRAACLHISRYRAFGHYGPVPSFGRQGERIYGPALESRKITEEVCEEVCSFAGGTALSGGPGIDTERLTLMMMHKEIKTIYKDGIKHMGKWFWHQALASRRHSVLIRYDEQFSRHTVLVYTLNAPQTITMGMVREAMRSHCKAGFQISNAELYRILDLKNEKEKDRLRTRLNGMVNQGEVLRVGSGRYEYNFKFRLRKNAIFPAIWKFIRMKAKEGAEWTFTDVCQLVGVSFAPVSRLVSRRSLFSYTPTGQEMV